MKVAEFKISGLMTVAIVVGMVAATFAITSQVTGDVEFRAMLDKPLRDMTIGQAIGFLVFAWVLFK